MLELLESKKWINERLTYITINCDLKDKDNKRAYDSLKTALKYVSRAIETENIEENY